MRVTRNAGPASALLSFFRYRSNHWVTRAWARPVSRSPPSWPPAIQSTETGAPLAAIRRSMASAWPSGNSESVWPCMMSAGTLMRSPTADGLLAERSFSAASSGCPALATRSYIAHSCGSNALQPPAVDTKIPAQSFL